MRDDLVARRQRYIQRQIEFDKRAVNVKFTGQAPAGTGPRNRHGLPQLPVGQHAVMNWPVLDLGDQPDVSRAEWTLEIGGLVDHPLTFTWDDFMAVPHDHAEAVRVEGRQVDPQDRVSRGGSQGLLGSARVLELRRALVQRSLCDVETSRSNAEVAKDAKEDRISLRPWRPLRSRAPS